MIKRFLAVCAVLCLSLAAHGATQPILQPYQTFLNPNAAGLPCAGCSLYSYAAGSTTPQPTYTDSGGLTQNQNPIILDTGGGAKIWLGANPYKFVLKDTLGSTIWTVDNISQVATLSSISGSLAAYLLKAGDTMTGALNWNTGANDTATANNLLSPTPVLFCPAGDTVAQCVALLPTGGGTVILGVGVWPSGSPDFTSPNIHIVGSGMPKFNIGYTALTGGTIIQGPILAHQGADMFELRNLGVDVGSTYVSGGGAVSDAIAIYNNGQVVGATQLQNVLLQNVACLGSSTVATYHCMLVENVNNAYINNVKAVKNTHGVVLKGTNSTIDGVWSAGHSTDSVDIKSETYANTNNDVVKNVKIASLSAPGDTGPFFINSGSFEIHSISASHIETQSVGDAVSPRAVAITGQDDAFPASDINLSDVIMDWPGGSTSGYACIDLIQSLQRVAMSGINCKNYYTGIRHTFPDATTNDFLLTGSQFTNIPTSAITTYGRWRITANTFNNITQNGILVQSGNTAIGNNTCTACGAYFNNVAGTLQFDFRAYVGNSSSPTISPAVIAGVNNATAGQLVIAFWNTFASAPVCNANVISANAPGVPAETVWVNAVTGSGVTFNVSTNIYAGQIHWQCIGLFQ